MRTLLKAVIVGMVVLPAVATAQYRSMNQSEALAEMERFASGKRVLYLAAHPDDENTRLIAWLSNGLNAQTTYLSLTRGSGGQNLIGDELGPDLGVIRENELLAARSVDGGSQLFTSAVDLGYSKDVREVWNQWNKEKITSEVVDAIRLLKPDFIITRFPPDERAGHGHHTASAELAIECAQLAADENYRGLEPWAVQGVWWNTSVWWDESLKDDLEAVHLDLSGFDPLLGDTYGAIGDAARSMHKCQGFGVPIDRGARDEYFKPLWTPESEGASELFRSYLAVGSTGMDSASILAQEANFALRIGDRAQSISKWLTLGTLLREEGTAPDVLRRWQNVLLHITGLYAEAYTTENPVLQGEENTYNIEIQPMLSGVEVSVEGILHPETWAPRKPIQIDASGFEHSLTTTSESFNTVTVRLCVNNQMAILHLPLSAKLVDRAIGEYREPVAYEPHYYLQFDKPVFWKYNKNGSIDFQIYAHSSGRHELNLKARANPSDIIWEHQSSEELQHGWNVFSIELPSKLMPGKYQIQADLDGQSLSSKRTISYPHIGTHYRYPNATATLAVLELSKKRIDVGYIEGAGDQMDEMLRSVGYEVTTIGEEVTDWSSHDAILVGIRAFNTLPWLREQKTRIEEYVRNGGTFVITYTTAGRGDGMLLPVPGDLRIGRDRVTEEQAPVEFILPEHSLLHYPNELLKSDFDGWVQERGLYFPSSFKNYSAPLRIKESTGIQYDHSTVVYHHGKGAVIYTGLSLFRELPAGVPGALRVLQNMIHYDPRK